MPRKKIIASLAGLVASVTIAWSIHGAMGIGSCGGEGKPECPPELAPYIIGIFAAVIVAIASAFAGSRHSVLGIFLGVGVGAIWAGAPVMGGIFLAVALLPLAAIPVVLVMKRRAERLVTEGAPAIATVVEIEDTGTTINKNPQVKLKLRITPQDGSAPFDGEKAVVVSRLALPQPGHRYPAWYDRADQSRFVIATDANKNAPPEVRRLFAIAQAESVTAQSQADPLDRLAKLNDLRTAGALTQAEFEDQKRKILDEA
ncbi:SHOCT domain-containing protein [Allorhizocola rhizosphaerae]|uniref:SHOCT domain-containing protein n=1 Tax=Allorhizocola rhizosphaerae TaxID=1872709 RepID=UPI000E3DDCD4|nr:SHOCT domain-containing protein [Allorhizocola rhizosphaerae]